MTEEIKPCPVIWDKNAKCICAGVTPRESYNLQSQWIKFDPEDKSTWPSSNTGILVWIPSYKGNFKHEIVSFYLEPNPKFIYADSRGMANITLRVSHWQPLPKPPEEIQYENF